MTLVKRVSVHGNWFQIFSKSLEPPHSSLEWKKKKEKKLGPV